MEQDLPTLQLPTVDAGDIEQEAALLRLQGITPSKLILRKRLQPTELTFSGDLIDASPLNFARVIPSQETLESIIDWARPQAAPVQDLIWQFLEDPEANLESTLKKLKLTPAKASSSTPLATILMNALPATKEDLSQLVAQVSPTTKRPEATVRQFIRRHQLTITDGIVQKES